MDISPDKQNIDNVFSNTVFYIDFYQREYKWTDIPVQRLLDDIFYKFNQEYKSSFEPRKEIILSKYSWYYLNTYVTNLIDGKVYVVDGQQRLTTITLIMIKLYRLSKSFKSKLEKWLSTKIAGYHGGDYEFWMNHDKHKRIFEELYDIEKDENNVISGPSITGMNLIKNYRIISKYLDKELSNSHRFETFVYYFLFRIVLINLTVEQTDVPMVFEVINDRGVKLKPHEILKGKLLGQIDKIELDTHNFNEKWEKGVSILNYYKEDEIDQLFIYYLKAKYSDNKKEASKFDSDYHREMFSNDINKNLRLNHNPTKVKSFLNNEFKFYTELYEKLLKYSQRLDNDYPSVFYNKLNEMDGQYLLIISSCELNDPQKTEKIKSVSYELDRAFSILQLQNSYDSNSFQEMLYKISKDIRNNDISTIRTSFDKHILGEISTRRNVEVTSPFQYSYFKNIGINLYPRFKRYFFARIEKFLADNMNLEMKHPLENLVTKTGSSTGFHIEHILSNNSKNYKLFNNDEDLFENERNRLGGLLLLKGKDNISSQNEPFSKKLKSYANTLYWNETLRSDSYKSKLDIKELKKKYKLNLVPYKSFGPKELEERQKLLFTISNIIWE